MSERAVVAVIDDLYDAVRARDHERFDRYLAPGVTVWESQVPSMMHGVGELAAYRDERDASETAAPATVLVADEMVIGMLDGAAVVRYRLVARGGDVRTEFRVTDVLRDDGDDGWRIVHHHAEQIAAHGEHGHG
jgi:ketosteroid isomerase-like protein